MDYDILTFKAKGDGEQLETEAIQAAIDACHANGGGTVHIPSGRFRTGTLELRSDVMLELAFGAVLVASDNPDDYRKAYPELQSLIMGYHDSPFNQDQHLIFAKRARHCGICGKGSIEANGSAFYVRDCFRNSIKQKPGGKEYLLQDWRPGATIAMLDCEDFMLEGFTLRDAPMFAIEIMHCRDARLNALQITSDFRLRNSDGIHVKSSQNLLVSDCRIESEDDAICFYTDHWEREMELSENQDYSCSHIVVSNCILKSACSAVRIGYMGNEPIRDIIMSNLVITGGEAVLDVLCSGGSDGFCAHGRHYTGPRIENVHLSNVVAENVKWGITINANSSLGATGSVGRFRFDRVNIRSSYGNYISGTAEHPVTDMLFRDCNFHVAGGPVNSTSLPDELPLFKSRTYAFAWLARHASHIRFLNCDLQCPDSFRKLVLEHCNDLIHDFQNCG